MTTRNKLLWISAGLLFLWILYYSVSGSGPNPNYLEEVAQGRMTKDRSFRQDATSPFKDSDFNGLDYYPVDPKYRVQASLERLESADRIFLETNDGKQQQYQQFAWARFSIDGDRLQLMVLRAYPIEDQDQFFLPFGDQTSAVETYGSGRYIDLRFKPGATRVEIDFNLAYSPFCAYNPSFSCPLPPSQNLLKVPIHAGEKNYD